MPELAEVEFYRKQWDAGLGSSILEARLHLRSRIFRDTDGAGMQTALVGQLLRTSETHGKKMLFRFGGGQWLGIHLGMTGHLRVEPRGFVAGKHDHVVLVQSERCLVFCDPRQFGQVLFHTGKATPPWWRNLPAEVFSSEFSFPAMDAFLQRHPRLPIKAVLLLQDGFPGVGNWMADEILWRAALDPRKLAGRLDATQRQLLWRIVRWVCRQALRTVGQNGSDPPRGWFFHVRWNGQGRCPRHRTPLRRQAVGGRTSAWCTLCQQG